MGSGGVAAESNTIRIGSQGSGAGEQNAAYIAGIYGATVGAITANVIIDSNGKLGTGDAPGTPPKFSSNFPTGASNVTGDGTHYQVPFDIIDFNVGGGYDNTTGLFTAPITGTYFFTASVELMVPIGGGNEALIGLMVSTGEFFTGNNIPTQNRVAGFFGSNTTITLQVSALVSMIKNQTIFVYVAADGGALTTDVFATTLPAHNNYFHGFFVA